MADNKVTYARRGRELATALALQMNDLAAWRNTYWDRTYNASGADEITDGDIAEVWQSLKHVRNYTPTQITTLNANIRIISEKSKRGVRFLSWLRAEISAFEPDLVLLNPLQAYIDGDVTASKDLGFFLREGLNGMNPVAPDKKAFGWVIVHHTTKPATGACPVAP